MFHIVEKYKTPAQIVLGIIGLTFIGFGANNLSSPGSDYIVKVGDEKVSEHALQIAIQNEQAAGNNAPSRDAVFQSLLQRAYLKQGAKLMGIAVSQEQIKQVIVDDPNFHDASGKFSQDLLKKYLDQRRMTEDQFVEDIREQFQLQNLLNLVQNGALVSDAQARQLINLTQATRTIRSFTFSPEAFAAQVKVDDAALQKYYEAHKKDYLIPQAVKLEYVALNIKDLADKQTVSAEEVQKAYDSKSVDLSPRAEIAHIFIPVMPNGDEASNAEIKAEVDKMAAELKAHPDSFAELAAKYSKDLSSSNKGGNLGYLSKSGGSGFGPEFDKAAFALGKGEVSDTVKSSLGYHVIKVLNVEAEPTLEQAKARIEAALKLKKAASAFNAAKEKLGEDTFNDPSSLAKAAANSGLKVESLDEWVTKAGAKEAGLPEALINAAFSDDVLKKKHNSEVIAINNETVWVIRAKEVREEKIAPFAEVKDTVRAAYLRSEAAKLAEKKAQETLAALKAGKTADVQWSPVSQLSAQDARKTMSPEAYAALLKARPVGGKPAYTLLEGMPAPVIMEIQSVSAPENADLQIPAAKQALVQQLSANVFDALLQYLDKKIDRTQGAQQVNNAAE